MITDRVLTYAQESDIIAIRQILGRSATRTHLHLRNRMLEHG